MKAIGVHVDSGSIYVSIVERKKDNFIASINKKQKATTDSSRGVFQTVLKILRKEGHQKKFTIATGLNAASVLIKHIEIPLKSATAAYKALPFQLETQIPYPIEEAIILSIPRRKEHQISMKIFSTHQMHVQDHLEKMWQFGVDPDYVGCCSQALYRYMKAFYSFDTGCVFHLSDEKMMIIVVHDGELVAAYEIEIGIKTLTEALSLDLPHHTENQLKALLFETELFEKSKDMYPRLHECLDQLYKEIDRALFYSSTKHKITFSFSVLSLGNSILLGDLLKSFVKNYPDYFFEFINQDGAQIHEHFEIPIGLALDVLQSDLLSMQFRVGTFVNPRSIKKRGKRILLASCFALFLTFFGYIATTKILNTKEKRIISQVDQFIQQHQDQIPNYQDKISKLDTTLISKMKFVKRAFGKKQKTLGYFVNPPRVYGHIQQIIRCLELFPAVDVKKLHFDLTQCPIFENPELSYEFELSLDLQSQTEEVARLFCEELSKSESLSNSVYELLKTEILNEYKVKFFVTNKK